MNDLIEGCRITGQVLLDGEDIYKGMDVNLLRRRVGMVFQNSVLELLNGTARCRHLG